MRIRKPPQRPLPQHLLHSLLFMPAPDLLKRIKEVAYLEGEFITRSGKPTHYYIDKYKFETLPDILDNIATELVPLFPSSADYDRIAAPELGAVPVAAVLSVKLKKPFVIVKKAAKEYGTKNLIEGTYKKGDRVVILEDILTTGGAALRAYDILKAEGLHVLGVVGVINREEGADQAIKEKGIFLASLFKATQLRHSS